MREFPTAGFCKGKQNNGIKRRLKSLKHRLLEAISGISREKFSSLSGQSPRFSKHLLLTRTRLKILSWMDICCDPLMLFLESYFCSQARLYHHMRCLFHTIRKIPGHNPSRTCTLRIFSLFLFHPKALPLLEHAVKLSQVTQGHITMSRFDIG